MAEIECDRVIDSWLKENPLLEDRRLNDELRSIHQLTALILVSSHEDALDFPEEVLSAWRRLISRYRVMVKQTELVFIDRMRKQGKSWEGIGEALELPADLTAEQYRRDLLKELDRLRPGSDPTPRHP